MVSLVCQRICMLAERDPRRAVPLARRLYHLTAPTDPDMAWASYTLGWALLGWERFAEARPLLHAAAQLFVGQHLPEEGLRCQRALLLVDLAHYARPELDAVCNDLAARCSAAGMLLEAARVRIDQARLMNVLGRPADAEVLLDQVRPNVSGEPIDDARWMRVRAVAAYLRANYDEARSLLTEAEQCFATEGYRLDVAKCWLELATVAFRQEQLDVALMGYRRAELLFTRLDTPLQRAFCARNIGGLLTMRGAYDQALGATLAALNAFTSLQRQSDIGGCHLHLGNIYFRTSRWEAALGSYLRAESCYTAAGAVGYQLIAKRNQAMIYLAQRQHDAARSLLTAVAEHALALGNQAELAEIVALQAALLAAEGHHLLAAQRYAEASGRFAALQHAPGVAECQLEHAWLLIEQGDSAAAQSLLLQATPTLEQHPHHYWRAAYGLARCAQSYGDGRTALDHYRSASTIVARLRSRLASEAVSSNLYQQAAHLHDDAIACAVALGQMEELLALSEGQRALVLQRSLALGVPPLPPEYRVEHDLLREGISRLLASASDDDLELERALEAYGDLLIRARHSAAPSPPPLAVPETPFNLALLREHLDRRYGIGWTALVYLLQGDRLLTVTVTSHGIELVQTPYDAGLRRLVERASLAEYQLYTFRDLPYLRGQTSHPWATLTDLGARLVPPSVRERLYGDHRLLIVPTGPLHALPWATLRLDGRWLAEVAVVQTLPSLAVWQALAMRTPAAGRSALLLGCADFGERAAPLPNVAHELDLVAAFYPDKATQELPAIRPSLIERSANGQLAEYALIHIASHAQWLATQGLAAHVKLADGDLLLSEIATLRLHGALVTLSACDGAAGDALSGEEVLSLNRAFVAAGAHGVLASLWPVYDAAVLLLMHHFYTALRQHHDAALSLALAQRACIAQYQQHADPRAAPLCWGSFVFTGV